METKLNKVTDPKVSLFYDNESTPCLALEFNTELTNENGFKGKANIQIHKIKLNNININTETKSRSYSVYLPPTISYSVYLPPTIISSKRTITFDLDCNDKDEACTIKIDEERKKMSLNDIEKELGYKIDLQLD